MRVLQSYAQIHLTLSRECPCSLILLTDSQRRSTINNIYCLYSNIHPDDELLIYSKHVEDDNCNELTEKSALFWLLLRKALYFFTTINSNTDIIGWFTLVSELRNEIKQVTVCNNAWVFYRR